MKVPCKNIPTYNFSKKQWTTTSFENQYEFGDFLEKECFKEPGEYKFHKELVRDLWCEKATIFKQNNYYTEYSIGTNEYNDFWDGEELKCRLGVLWFYDDRWYYTTRDYYFLLNYFLMLNKEIGFVKTFADPRDVQYHMMLYEKIAECKDLNSAILKRRQMMYSNCHVAKSLNYIYFEHTKRIKWGAYDAKFILDPINGSWFMLDIAKTHLNQNTGWTKDFSPDKPGSLLQRVQVQESGGRWHWEGNDSSIVFNTYAKDPGSGVGGPTWMLWYEEGGFAPTANLTLQFLEPAIQSGGKRVGTFIIGGSVGDLDQCKPLKDFTLHPKKYGFYGVPTKWEDSSGIVKIRGLFIPAQYGMPEAMDEHGNSLVDLALEILDKSEKIGWKKGEMRGNVLVMEDEDPWQDLPEEDYILKKSQNPKTIEEAFAYRKIAKFNPQRCEKRQKEIEILKERNEYYQEQGLMDRKPDGTVYLKKLSEFKDRDRPTEMKFPVDPKIKDKRGVVNIYEPYNPKFEYFGGVDSIEAEITTTSESLFSIHIYRRSYTEFDQTTGKTHTVRGKIVADWAGRFDGVDETNEHGMMLLEYFKARTSCERNKPNFINHCRRNGKSHLLTPTKDLPFDKDIDITGRENGQFGVYRDSAGKVLQELIRVTKEYLNSEMDVIYMDDKNGNQLGFIKKVVRGYDYINGYWTLEELKKYNEDDNFDRADSLFYALHYGTAEELSFQNKVVKVQSEVKEDKSWFDSKPKQIKKYGPTIKKYGGNRNILYG